MCNLTTKQCGCLKPELPDEQKQISAVIAVAFKIDLNQSIFGYMPLKVASIIY